MEKKINERKKARNIQCRKKPIEREKQLKESLKLFITNFPDELRCPNVLYQDRQCTYNQTLGRVRATIVAVKKQWVLHNRSVCICTLRYAATKAHAPYCRLWPTTLYNIFPNFLINGTIFEKKKVTDHEMCFHFPYNFCLKHFSF